ncbi:MAG: cupin domain-containing protein [Methanosarcinales archaeon]
MFVKRLEGGLEFGRDAKRIVAIWETYLPIGEMILPNLHTDLEEIYYILSGKGLMHIEDERKEVESGDVIYIPPEKVHTLQNISQENLRFLTLSVNVSEKKDMSYLAQVPYHQ